MKQDKIKSPFHNGEKSIQTRLGIRDRMEKIGQLMIRDHMPDQHQEFYSQIPYVLLGYADQDGNPWASILYKQSGLIQSLDNKHLQINTQPISGDPLEITLKKNQQQGKQTRLGLLGIELPSRRRNRLAGHVISYTNTEINIKVDQTFGNCPKYIQSRELEFLQKNEQTPIEMNEISELDPSMMKLIKNSDTFFIASYICSENFTGADVSHRGGAKGFIRVNDSQSLTIPDYRGNNSFNTFGNIVENSKAGLLFLDYDSGDILMLTGQAEIIWGSTDINNFEGAQRLLEFNMLKGRIIKNALPFKWSNPEFSRNLT